MAPLPSPINFIKWANDNKHMLQPPVGNYLIQKGPDFIVMAVGGPNSRTDYHINETEEWFYQVKGDMLLKVVDPENGGTFRDIPIREGEIYLLPPNVPHNPCRFKDTVGIVLERTRPPGSLDRMRWYCENPKCRIMVYEEAFHCTDLGTQLIPVIEKYYGHKELRTCGRCQHVNGVPKLIDGEAVLTHD